MGKLREEGSINMETIAPTTWYNYLYMYPDGYVKNDVDLTDIAFYVGKGQDSRVNAHEREAKTECKCPRCNEIREIWLSGQPVKKRLVFETLVEEEAFKNEKELISKHSGVYLTNVAHHASLATQEAKKVPQLPSLTDSLSKEETDVLHLLLAGRDSYRISEIVHTRGRIYSLIMAGCHYNTVVLSNSFDFYELRYHLAEHSPDLVICATHNTVLPITCLSLTDGRIAMPHDLPAQITNMEAQRHRSKTGSQVLLGMYLCGMRQATELVSKLPARSRRRYIEKARLLGKRTRGRPVGTAVPVQS